MKVNDRSKSYFENTPVQKGEMAFGRKWKDKGENGRKVEQNRNKGKTKIAERENRK